MSRPLLSALTLALLSVAPVWSFAANAPRYSASASLSPSPVASSGRFRLQAGLHPAGTPMPSDTKQADPIRSAAVVEAATAGRYRLTAVVTNKASLAVCGLDTMFQNGFE